MQGQHYHTCTPPLLAESLTLISSWNFNNKQEGDTAALSSGQQSTAHLKNKFNGNPNKGPQSVCACVCSCSSAAS